MSEVVLLRGIALATKACEEDTKRNYEEAICLYRDATQCFIYAAKHEPDEEKAGNIRARCMKYLERADKLVRYISKKAAEDREASKKNSSESEDAKNEKEEGDRGKFQDALSGAITTEKENVKWDEVAGLDAAKKALQETVIFAFRFPQISKGNSKLWRSILLYGPPGTGKTHIAKAVATEADSAKLFSLSFADLVSKWRDEGARIVKRLFNLARENKPCIIFTDDLDALYGFRSEGSSEKVVRIRTELIVQMKAVERETSGIIVIGATNMPWELDSDTRRIFGKRIYTPLPEPSARGAIFKFQLGATPHSLLGEDFKELGERSEGFSGTDISLAVKDALMQPIRVIKSCTHFKKVRGPSREDANVTVDDLLTPCQPRAPGAIEMNWTQVPGDKLLEPLVNMHGMLASLSTQKPTVNGDDLKKFEEFTNNYGQEG